MAPGLAVKGAVTDSRGSGPKVGAFLKGIERIVEASPGWDPFGWLLETWALQSWRPGLLVRFP